MAAFLHSHREPDLIIYPTLLGPLMAAGNVALILACGGAYVSAHFSLEGMGPSFYLPFWLILASIAALVFFSIAEETRRYCREVENLSHELQNFRFDDAVAWCCSVGHVDPDSGAPLICDRAVVRKCICSWFGCVDEFERSVRTEVLDVLKSHLSTALVSYRRVVEASPCILWVFLDFSVGPIRHGNVDTGIWLLLRGFAYWLGVVPILFLSLYTMAHLLRRSRRPRCVDKLVSLLLVCFGVCLFVCIAALEETLFRWEGTLNPKP